MNPDLREGYYSVLVYAVYVETSTAHKFEENIAPLKAVDVIQDFIRAVVSGKVGVKEGKNE